MTERRSALGAIASVVLLAAWLGAAVLVASVVAPAAFAVLPSRALAGALVGRVLPVLFWSGVLVAVAVGTLAATLRGRGWRVASLAVMAIACAAAQFVVAPRIAHIRSAAGVAIDLLEPTDARRLAFGRLHAASVAWMGVAALGAFVALCLIARSLAAGVAQSDRLPTSSSPHG